MSKSSSLLARLMSDYQQFSFVLGDQFSWSPQTRTIMYRPIENKIDKWSLIHELGHSLLDHTNFNSDSELLEMEVQAWDKAREVGSNYSIVINSDHIEDCLDTYRDWLHQRSKCPECGAHGVQQKPLEYTCTNCAQNWKVSESRHCRPYRMKQKTKSPLR